MMDMVFISEEKDKIASALVYLIYNIIPYLKNHRLVAKLLFFRVFFIFFKYL